MIIHGLLIAALYAGSCTGQLGGGGGCSIDQKCYVPCPDYTLADAFPFIRQTPVSCDDCMNLCNSLQGGTAPFTCQSAVFDAQMGSCDIFAVADQSGGFGRRKRHGGGDCGGGGGGGGCQQQKVPHKQKYPGRIYLQPTGMCAGQGGNGTGGTTAAGGAGAGGASSAAGGETTTAATTPTTSAAPAKKKMRDQQGFRRRDDAVAGASAGRCIARKDKSNRKDCSSGFVVGARKRIECKPSKAECDAS